MPVCCQLKCQRQKLARAEDNLLLLYTDCSSHFSFPVAGLQWGLTGCPFSTLFVCTCVCLPVHACCVFVLQALEHTPEVFATVEMLYVDMEVSCEHNRESPQTCCAVLLVLQYSRSVLCWQLLAS